MACYLLAFELFSLSDSVLADVGSSRSDDDSALERLSAQAERRGTLWYYVIVFIGSECYLYSWHIWVCFLWVFFSLMLKSQWNALIIFYFYTWNEKVHLFHTLDIFMLYLYYHFLLYYNLHVYYFNSELVQRSLGNDSIHLETFERRRV